MMWHFPTQLDLVEKLATLKVPHVLVCTFILFLETQRESESRSGVSGESG